MQVPLLLRLGEDSRALQRAMDSGDTDLVYLVLFSLYRRLALKDFVTAISSRPKVLNLFLAYCNQVVNPPAIPSTVSVLRKAYCFYKSRWKNVCTTVRPLMRLFVWQNIAYFTSQGRGNDHSSR